MFHYLTQHPSLHGSSISKETHYFIGRSFVRSTFACPLGDWLVYRSFFPTVFFKLYHQLVLRQPYMTLEACPSLRFPQLARRIADVNPTAKAIVVSRL
jgi:hypothetical protein